MTMIRRLLELAAPTRDAWDRACETSIGAAPLEPAVTFSDVPALAPKRKPRRKRAPARQLELVGV